MGGYGELHRRAATPRLNVDPRTVNRRRGSPLGSRTGHRAVTGPHGPHTIDPRFMSARPDTSHWLNRSTAGIALASLCSDVSHELATAVLPTVLLSLGAGPAAVGLIEGSADGLSAVAKLWGGVVSDRVARRKPLASIGYLVTALGTAAIGVCATWWQVMLCRMAAWIGRGSRSPARDVLMAEAAAPEALGKAFGMERVDRYSL